MNNEQIQSQEIQTRMESDLWNQEIANKVSIKFKRQQTRSRIVFSVSAFLFLGTLIASSFLVSNNFINASLAEVDTYRLFLYDDFTPLYDTIYQEESISSLRIQF